jgi:signal transduction histidine kinase
MSSPDRILIVDDDPNVCKMLSIFLSAMEMEFEIAFAYDGYQAIERIEAERFNVVILDLMLPGPNGIEILRHIREQQSGTEVIVLTAHASLTTAIEAVRLGAYDYITKPCNAQNMQSTVRRAIDKQHLTTRLAAVYDLSREMALSPDADHVAETVLDIAGRVLEFEMCSLWLLDEERQELHLLAARGIGEEATSKLPLNEEGIVVTVAQSGEPLYVLNAQEDPKYSASEDGNQSQLAVPLKVKGQVIGVLSVESADLDAFLESDVRLLSTLAAQAAVAIENARLFEEVHAGHERLQALSRRLVEIQEVERSHVARELHDETGQALSSLLLGLSLLEREADRPEAIVARVSDLEAMVDEMLENLHRLAMHLRPATLDHLGLVAALEQYVETFSNQHKLPVRFETVGLGDQRLPPPVETVLYRIVQEALTNVMRHAQATRVDVLLEQRGNQVVTIIEDDGVGFEPETALRSGRLGLFGMRERAEMLGGTLTIESAAETGTTVYVEVPYVRSHSDRG